MKFSFFSMSPLAALLGSAPTCGGPDTEDLTQSAAWWTFLFDLDDRVTLALREMLGDRVVEQCDSLMVHDPAGGRCTGRRVDIYTNDATAVEAALAACAPELAALATHHITFGVVLSLDV